MNQLTDFIKAIKVSPPSGLIIKKGTLTAEKVKEALKDTGQQFTYLEIDSSDDGQKVLFEAIKKAVIDGSWLVADIVDADVPNWLYQQVRMLAGNGHMYNYDSQEDITLAQTESRLLVLLTDEILNNSAFDGLISNFSLILRDDSNID